MRVSPKKPESVWDYPRPPALEPSAEEVAVTFAGQQIAATERSYRVLETSHPPTYYLPAAAFVPGVLRPVERRTFCEWKGVAAYFDIVVGERIDVAGAWTYPDPVTAYAALAGHVALYPARMDACTVDGEQVQAQDGDFYGGWITSRVVGPFKGAPGTRGW